MEYFNFSPGFIYVGLIGILLGIWKFFEIVYWLFTHVSITIN